MGGPDHLKTFDYVGIYRYFLTFCTDARRPTFTNAEAVQLVLSQISRAADEERFAILAYCFMPDHVHLLIEATALDSAALRFINRAKQYSGFHFQRTFGRRLWQRYGFEHVLRDDETTIAVARYILENPVRAGLVKSPERYPYLGSNVLSVGELLEGLARSG